MELYDEASVKDYKEDSTSNIDVSMERGQSIRLALDLLSSKQRARLLVDGSDNNSRPMVSSAELDMNLGAESNEQTVVSKKLKSTSHKYFNTNNIDSEKSFFDDVGTVSSSVKKPNINQGHLEGDDSIAIESSISEINLHQLSNAKEILRAIQILANQENNNLCAQLELLVRFDELKGWRESGSKSCAAWMNAHLQIDHRTAWERLRVGRELRTMPVIRRLFQLSKLSWSKVRLLTRIANAENEHMLAHASIDATVSDVRRLCDEYRWPTEQTDEYDENLSNVQFERRSLSWQQLSDGSTLIRLVLPPEQAQNYLHAIEQCEDILYHDENCALGTSNIDSRHKNHRDTIEQSEQQPKIATTQRRADAAVLLAERSIAFNGTHPSAADRFQVVLNIDNDSLVVNQQHVETSGDLPSRRPMIEGIGPIPVATARKIACDCSIIKLLTEQGEPLSIGRKQRIWTPPMRRAILTRDRHCQFPGCSSHRFLHIHHIKHWADGGETSIDNGVCLCQFHHQLVHNQNYSIERVTIESCNLVTTGLFSSSKKKLLPTRCRFVFKRAIDYSKKVQFDDSQPTPRSMSKPNSKSLHQTTNRCAEHAVLYSFL